MAEKRDEIKTKHPFDWLYFHIEIEGRLVTSKWAYGLVNDPNAGIETLGHCEALGGIVWPAGRSVHVFMGAQS